MTADPYRPPSVRVVDPPGEEFGWVPALVGGAAGMGAAYTAAIIASPFFQHWHAAQGVGMDDLYMSIAQSPTANFLGHGFNVAGEILGAIAAAQLGKGKSFAHALASATVPYVLLVAGYLGVFPSPFPLWSQLLSFLFPLPAALLGAWLYAERNVRL